MQNEVEISKVENAVTLTFIIPASVSSNKLDEENDMPSIAREGSLQSPRANDIMP